MLPIETTYTVFHSLVTALTDEHSREDKRFCLLWKFTNLLLKAIRKLQPTYKSPKNALNMSMNYVKSGHILTCVNKCGIGKYVLYPQTFSLAVKHLQLLIVLCLFY